MFQKIDELAEYVDIPMADRLIEYYELRCDIAHGRLCQASIDLPTVFRDLREVVTQIG